MRTQNYIFLMEALKYDSDYSILFGDPRNPEESPCVELTYEANTPRSIKLDGVLHDDRCSVGKKLQRRTGTVEMLQSALKMVIDHFPQVELVYFNDASGFDCQNKHVYLCYYSFLRHGKTWYEMHFNAQMMKTAKQEKLNNARERLTQKPTDEYGFLGCTSHKTWQEYFNSLNCLEFVTYQRKIEKWIGMKLVYSEWYITKDEVKTYKGLDFEKTKTGGHLLLGSVHDRQQPRQIIYPDSD